LTGVADEPLEQHMERDEHEQQKTIRFTLDGRTLTTHQHEMTAADVLRHGGLDPATFDLARLREDHPPRKFTDTEDVHLKDGDKFVSVRQSAPVG